ncbi:Probable E3 ubiquitin-protein ligase ipaH7.8 [Pandoraea pulmonicola]|uniref:Probable E3 ubiquitin-protein ligase ipaH7.8 n=2 Tax=Pandoraea pulmonicola TaxID=93221 RepID=A0AAJ4ZCX7_PANPU|nr:Probable E3 ubiquitin-protein ligase ipaH7.8 [Pandoraea pulmonicola]
MPRVAGDPGRRTDASGRNARITTVMLQTWTALGQTGIEAMGGLGGLARRDNVSLAALRRYLRADGRLTALGEDRLNAVGNVMVTDTMLRAWSDLGQAGIEASGGLGGLARRDNVSLAALRNYLRANGTLTQRGEDRLNTIRNAYIRAAPRPLHEAVRDWFSNDEQAQIHQWQAHSEEPHAAQFFRFLNRLKASINYNAEFKTAVAGWLAKLAQDGELRQLAFLAAQEATETCEDRVALTYNNLTKLSHARAVSRGDHDNSLVEIVERGRGAFRLDALEKIARTKARSLPRVDEIEVFLAYQVHLRERLKLPTDIANMRFFNVAGVTATELENAEQEVHARESAEFPQYFLVEWEPWQQVLARLDPEGTERAHQKMQDMLARYEQEMATQLVSLGLPGDHDTQAQVGVGIMKAQQLATYKELTREFLRKRGEEALMDRIMGADNR